MNPGDLVSMANRCGGPPGRTKCETALVVDVELKHQMVQVCLLYTSPSPRDLSTSRMPSSA